MQHAIIQCSSAPVAGKKSSPAIPAGLDNFSASAGKSKKSDQATDLIA